MLLGIEISNNSANNEYRKQYLDQGIRLVMQSPSGTQPQAQPQAQPQSASQQTQIMVSNTETIPGMKITKSLGVVTGSTVRAKHIGKDILAGLKNIVGGELKAYTELLQESRAEATNRMLMDCMNRGGNAVVNVRYATSNVANGASELFAYGTAVTVE